MEITIEKEGDKTLVQLSGKIDEAGADKLKNVFTTLDTTGNTEVAVDFKNVSYVGSSGIGKLLLFYKNLGVKHIKLKVIGVSPVIYEMFKELKLDTIFLIEQQ